MEAGGDTRRDVAQNIGEGGSGGGWQVPRVGASPRRPFPPAADAQHRPSLAAEPACDGDPGSPAHSHRSGADGSRRARL